MFNKARALLQAALAKFASVEQSKIILADAIEVYHAALAREVEKRLDALDAAAERVEDQTNAVAAARAHLEQEQTVQADLEDAFVALDVQISRQNDVDNEILDTLERFEDTLSRTRLAPPADSRPVVVQVGETQAA